MNNCTLILDQFTAYSDNELSAGDAETFKTHIASCPACAAELGFYQQTLITLKNIEPAAAPPDLLTGIHEKLEQKSPLRRFLHWIQTANPTMSIPAAAATVVIAFAGMAFYKTAVLNEHLPGASLSGKTTSEQQGAPSAPQLANLSTGSTAANEMGHPDIPLFEDNGFNPGFFQTNIAPHGTPASSLSFASTGMKESARSSSAMPADSFFNNYINKILGTTSHQKITPDIFLTVKTPDKRTYTTLYHHLLKEKSWHTEIYQGNLFLIFLAPDKLHVLHRSLSTHNVVFSPPWPQAALSGPNKDVIMVAVRLK